MKKIINTCMIIVFCFISITQPVHASNYLEDNYQRINEDGSISTFYDIYGNQLTLSQVNELTDNKNQNLSTFGAVYPVKNTVLVNSYAIVYGTTTRVTPYVKGPATITYSTSLTTTSTTSVNFGVDINELIFKNLAIKFGVSYTRSSSSATTFSSGFNVSSGRTGAVYFTPLLYSGTCTYVNDVGQGTSTYVTFPKTLGGFTDGLYELRQS